MSTALTGPAADLGQNMKTGVQAALDRVNRAGGVRGRKLRLIALDDGYEPARTAPNMRRLIEKDNVLAIIGNVGTPTAIASLPIVDEQRVLFWAPFTGAGVLRRSPPDRYVYNYRASYIEETAAMVDVLVEKAGIKPERVGFFTQRDGYGDAGYVGGLAALKRHGLEDEQGVLHARYERNTVAVENALAEFVTAAPPPQAAILVGAYAPCAQFIRKARELGLDLPCLAVSFVGSKSLAQRLPPLTKGVVVTQVVPHPVVSKLPLVAEYRRDLALSTQDAAPDFGSLEGYIAGRLLLVALERIPGRPTRENIVGAVEELGRIDLGLGSPLVLNRDEHQASHRVWPTVLREGSFAPMDWSQVVTMVNPR